MQSVAMSEDIEIGNESQQKVCSSIFSYNLIHSLMIGTGTWSKKAKNYPNNCSFSALCSTTSNSSIFFTPTIYGSYSPICLPTIWYSTAFSIWKSIISIWYFPSLSSFTSLYVNRTCFHSRNVQFLEKSYATINNNYSNNYSNYNTCCTNQNPGTTRWSWCCSWPAACCCGLQERRNYGTGTCLIHSHNFF